MPLKREYKRNFRELIDHLPQTIFELDIDGKCRFSNQNGYETFGYSEEDIAKGIIFTQLFIPEDRKRVTENVYHILKSKKVEGHEYTAQRKDGSVFHALIFSNPIRHEGSPSGLRGIVIDITDRKQVERELKNSRDELRNLSTHLQSIREEERANIAREIHDELGQSMTALKMDLNWLMKKVLPDQKTVLDKIESMSQLIDSTIQTVRRLSTELRPGLLDDLGLTAAIEWYCGEFQNRTGISCNLKLGQEEITLDQNRAIAIFRIFQETLTNVARHSSATHVDAELAITDHTLNMNIRDNGVGIPEEKIFDPQSLGLIGVRERVYPFGGRVEIQAPVNGGTTVQVTIPLDHKDIT
ncbi:MAG: PAS domain-containing sensor histidine kinase [Candidatus Marinimicrobia bacterium]|nr:PAS domain-containing sensor histidine kinase [Candidatus Neomarinimicrobiota bacterium]